MIEFSPDGQYCFLNVSNAYQCCQWSNEKNTERCRMQSEQLNISPFKEAEVFEIRNIRDVTEFSEPRTDVTTDQMTRSSVYRPRKRVK